jgi:hypothetical protein
MKKTLDVRILPQPTETTCGPTCLHAVYRYYQDRISLTKLIEEIPHLEDGGTLAVMLGTHALKRGYKAKIYTYNLHMFDPTWFLHPETDLGRYLSAQKSVKRNKKLRLATDAYIEFLELGGKILFEDLTAQLLRSYLEQDKPILTGLSATYLYRSAREIGETNEYNSIAGEPSGHFVVLSGYDKGVKNLLVSDPFHLNPFAGSHYYWVDVQRAISSILLGIVSYDANLLVIEPNEDQARQPKDSERQK